MKTLLIVLSLLAPFAAQAGYSCSDSQNNSINLENHWIIGTGADLQSEEVQKFYRKLGLEVGTLKTVVDPDSKKYVTEGDFPTYQIMLYAPDSGVENVWGLSLEFSANGKKLNARLSDMQGNGFEYKMNCRRTPDLE